jgi:hypothetical protein
VIVKLNTWPSARSPHGAGGSVDECRLHGCVVGSEHDVWIEHREKSGPSSMIGVQANPG